MLLEITELRAIFLSCIASAAFVGSFYLKNYFVQSPMMYPKYKAFREDNPNQMEWALHPVEIKQRTISLAIACLFNIVLIFTLSNGQPQSLKFYNDKPILDGTETTLFRSIAEWLGLWPVGFSFILKVILLNSLLFIGEIFYLLVQAYQSYRNELNRRNPYGYKNFKHYLWAGLVFSVFGVIECRTPNWRKLKEQVFAPFLEELTYRGIIFGLFRDCGTFNKSPTLCLVLLPSFFAFAHVHALWRKAF